MALFLKFGNIKGNATAKGFEKQIGLLSVNFAVSRDVNMESGRMANRESTKPTLSEVTVTKQADNSVAAILKEALTGSDAQEALITFVRTGKSGAQSYMTYKLSNCIVSSYSISASGDDEPMETISLSYSKLDVSYTDYDETNKAGSPVRVSYDLKTMVTG